MRRYRRSYRGQAIAVAIALILVALRWWSGDLGRPTSRVEGGASAALAPGVYQVERVVDGDTLLLRVGHRRLRLQGVDSPETVKEGTPVEQWGPEATAFTQRFVRDADGRVRIEVDGEGVDRHGRYLAFVWHDDRMLNEELIRAGLARARLNYHYSDAKKARLRRAQSEAQRARLGLWSQ